MTTGEHSMTSRQRTANRRSLKNRRSRKAYVAKRNADNNARITGNSERADAKRNR
jgi:hypothetical protein